MLLGICVWQIVFEAIRGPTLRSDIAIDDIQFKRGPCEGKGLTMITVWALLLYISEFHVWKL